MLRTCECVSSAGTINAPPSYPSGKRILSWSAIAHHRRAHCFSISRSSSDLDWRTVIVVLAQQKGRSISKGYNHLYIEQQSLDIWLVFQIQAWPTQNLLCNEFWQVCLRLACWSPSQRLLINFVTPLWYFSQGTAARWHFVPVSSSGLEKVSSLRLVFCCHQMNRAHGTRETQWLWSHHYVKYIPRRCRAGTAWNRGRTGL